MTREEVKRKLQGYRMAQRQLEIAQRELEAFEASLTPPIDYSKPRVGGGKVADMADMVAKLSVIHDKIHRDYMDASQQLIEVKDLISRVEDAREREILTRRYISCQHWDTISYEMRLDRRWVFRVHDKALDSIAEDGTIRTDKRKNSSLGKGVDFN